MHDAQVILILRELVPDAAALPDVFRPVFGSDEICDTFDGFVNGHGCEISFQQLLESIGGDD